MRKDLVKNCLTITYVPGTLGIAKKVAELMRGKNPNAPAFTLIEALDIRNYDFSKIPSRRNFIILLPATENLEEVSEILKQNSIEPSHFAILINPEGFKNSSWLSKENPNVNITEMVNFYAKSLSAKPFRLVGTLLTPSDFKAVANRFVNVFHGYSGVAINSRKYNTLI